MTIAERLGMGKQSGHALAEDAYIDTAALIPRHRRIPRDLLLMAVLVLASLGSFGLGVLAGREDGGGEPGERVWIEKLSSEALPAAVKLGATSTSSGSTAAKPAPATSGALVASKSGTKYYLPWCGTAKRIKEENRVWFVSKAEAEAAGYEPAKNCKGL